MAITDKIKYGLDVPRWQQMAIQTAHAAGGSWASDYRNGVDSYSIGIHLASAALLNIYYAAPNGVGTVINPGISAFGAGSDTVFVPSMTYVGSIGAGCSTSMIVTTTNNGTFARDGMVLSKGFGFKIRIIGNSAGGSGKVEERFIIGNTAGTTPTIFINPSTPLSFTPANGDTYEIIAGKIFCLGTTAGATQFRHYRIGVGDMVSSANTTLTVATQSTLTALDEQYVPYTRKSGEGFVVGSTQYDNYLTSVTTLFDKYCLVATDSAAGSITGQAASGDAGVLENEYRNFQIRIVEDTSIPTAVGQRRIIASHTAGASPIYTLGSNWSVTPSTTAKFVIEYPNQILLFTVAAGTTTYTYNPTAYTINNGTTSHSTNTWSTAYFGARGTVIAAGAITFPCFGIVPDTLSNGTRSSRHSYIWSFRGGATTLDLLDIAGGTSGSWTNGVSYNSQSVSLSTGTSGTYSPYDNQGRWGYLVIGNTSACFRFDVQYLSFYPWCQLPTQSGTAAVGNRMFSVLYHDINSGGTDKLTMIYCQSHLATTLYRSEAII